ncbi:MAG: hypothetical protein E7496_10040 [Ruminococcus sp.]|nr:hypothetical protein [Ruminococcus sp.]MBR4320639.1 hypothetical protein [Oscillospiraceae bacterium]
MSVSAIVSILGHVLKFIIKYWDIIKNWVKATIKWLKDKVKEKLQGKKNGRVVLASTPVLKKAVMDMANTNVYSLDELQETVDSLEKIESEGHKNMMVDIDENGNTGIWEAVRDEDEDVLKYKGSYGHVTITN